MCNKDANLIIDGTIDGLVFHYEDTKYYPGVGDTINIIFNEEDYNEKADVYSFGVVLYYILTRGQVPNIKLSDLFRRKKVELPSSFTDFSKDLINQCMEYDSSIRPSFQSIVEQIENNHYNLVPLTETELSNVMKSIQEYKTQIPSY